MTKKPDDKVVPIDGKKDEEPGMGHNAPNGKELLEYISRIEELEGQKKDLSSDIGDLKKEAAQSGIQTKVLNEILRERKRMATLGKEGWENFQDELEASQEAMGKKYLEPIQMVLTGMEQD